MVGDRGGALSGRMAMAREFRHGRWLAVRVRVRVMNTASWIGQTRDEVQTALCVMEL